MDDRTLVLKAQAGDLGSFDQLIDLHLDFLRKHAVSVYRSQGWRFIDEVISGAVRVAWLRIKVYDPDQTAFPTWLCWQCRTAAREETRFWNREKETSLDDMMRRGLVPATEGPSSLHEAAELRRQLWQAVNSLPRCLRFPFILHVCRGYPLARVARRLGIGTEAARYRVHKAKALLAKRLGSGWFGGGLGTDWADGGEEPEGCEPVAA